MILLADPLINNVEETLNLRSVQIKDAPKGAKDYFSIYRSSAAYPRLVLGRERNCSR
jgi:hypothetical protein